jgi:hypothetical protein
MFLKNIREVNPVEDDCFDISSYSHGRFSKYQKLSLQVEISE